MRVVIQRVVSAEVAIEHARHSAIGGGLLLLLGIEETDTAEDVTWLVRKSANLRIFNDEKGVMNRSVKEVDGEILLISQFTLHASTRKGNRPSYIRAAGPEHAIPLYHQFIDAMEIELDKKIASGKFGAHMQVSLINDGPVTIMIDTKNKE